MGIPRNNERSASAALGTCKGVFESGYRFRAAWATETPHASRLAGGSRAPHRAPAPGCELPSFSVNHDGTTTTTRSTILSNASPECSHLFQAGAGVGRPSPQHEVTAVIEDPDKSALLLLLCSFDGAHQEHEAFLKQTVHRCTYMVAGLNGLDLRSLARSIFSWTFLECSLLLSLARCCWLPSTCCEGCAWDP